MWPLVALARLLRQLAAAMGHGGGVLPLHPADQPCRFVSIAPGLCARPPSWFSASFLAGCASGGPPRMIARLTRCWEGTGLSGRWGKALGRQCESGMACSDRTLRARLCLVSGHASECKDSMQAREQRESCARAVKAAAAAAACVRVYLIRVGDSRGAPCSLCFPCRFEVEEVQGGCRLALKRTLITELPAAERCVRWLASAAPACAAARGAAACAVLTPPRRCPTSFLQGGGRQRAAPAGEARLACGRRLA